jgi:hypothetical protein
MERGDLAGTGRLKSFIVGNDLLYRNNDLILKPMRSNMSELKRNGGTEMGCAGGWVRFLISQLTVAFMEALGSEKGVVYRRNR